MGAIEFGTSFTMAYLQMKIENYNEIWAFKNCTKRGFLKEWLKNNELWIAVDNSGCPTLIIIPKAKLSPIFGESASRQARQENHLESWNREIGWQIPLLAAFQA